MANNWKEYQAETAAFFRALGLDAETDVTARGVRTSHKVDVLVRFDQVGFDILWIVECKYWTTRVSKLHVMALREIVDDIGADRGILLSETGFQSGAVEASTLTNVYVTSLAEVRNTATKEFMAMRLRELHDRVGACKERYWSIPKETRIAHGLRPDFGGLGYSAVQVIEFLSDLLSKALRGTYPVESDTLGALSMFGSPRRFATGEEVVSFAEPMLGDLDAKLKACETSPQTLGS